MAVQVSHTVPMGDGRVQVFGRNPDGQMGHVIVGLDLLADGTAYRMLQIAADKLDKKSRDLDRQSTLDSEADT